jgi:hypothetical protein
MAPTRLSPVVGYHLSVWKAWLRFADLTITPEHGKPSHGRSLPFLRCEVGHVFDWRSMAAVGRTRHLAPTQLANHCAIIPAASCDPLSPDVALHPSYLVLAIGQCSLGLVER